MELVIDYFYKAVEQGNEWAQYHLGVMYLDGTGNEHNAYKGAEYIRKATSNKNEALSNKAKKIWKERKLEQFI